MNSIFGDQTRLLQVLSDLSCGIVFRVLLVFASVVLLPVPNGSAETGAQVPVISAGKLSGDEARTRFVLEVDRQIDPAVSALADPYRLIIDLPEVVFELPEDAGRTGKGLVTDWRFGRFAKGKSRIVLDLDKPVRIDKTLFLPGVDDQAARLVLDLVETSRSGFLEYVKQTRQTLSNGTGIAAPKGDRLAKNGLNPRPVIVIDPGHGGIDTGAVGVGGTLEKAVVLEFSHLLKKKLTESGFYDLHMTRSDDTFIPLSERVAIGHDHAADLFVSIHADSVRRERDKVRGATVYTLSDKASDRLAAELAESENMSDIIAGVQLDEEPEEVTDILLDLARRETRTFSVFFAKTLVEELRSAVRLIKNPHRSAGFQVLRAHDVPSVLVELGYLSNKHDEKLLISEEWRERMADAMVQAIHAFFKPRIGEQSGKLSQ